MTTCLKNNRIYIGGVASAPTTNVEPGDLYYNSAEDVLYRRDGNSTWVEIGSGSGITISPTEINVNVGRDKGKGWFDTTRGGLYIWDEQSWIEILDPESASKTYISNTEPVADGQGDYWYKSNSAELYIWDGGTWRLIAGDPTALDELDELIDITNTGTNGQVLQANGDDTFTFNAHTQTLSNKTLVDPIANNLKIGGISGGAILFDSNSNEHLTFSTTTNAVNQVKFSNAATGNPPEIASEGETNVPLNLSGKGTGNVQVNTGVAFLSHEVSTSASCSLVKTTTIFNAGGTITPTLANGSVAGQTKIFTNKNSGNAILTPASFAGGTSITLGANEGCVLVWDGTNWQVVANNGGAIA